MSTALVVGGSSGLGLELGVRLCKEYHKVVVTGRRDPEKKNISFRHLDIDANTVELGKKLDELVDSVDTVDMLVYAAGFYQEGTIRELSDDDIVKMNNVGFLAPAMLLKRILKRQFLPGYIAVTSTSQWTPRLREPVYTGVKAALGHFSHSVSFDSIAKTLVAAPAGMKTRFWDATEKDTTGMLDAQWVADQIVKLYDDHFIYRYARVLRDPPRIEIVEQRKSY